MFKAYVLVRNLASTADCLDFGEFTIAPVGDRFKTLREIFSSVDVNRDDWIFEKSYEVPPLGPPGSPVGGIPKDIEDVLLILRLYKAGDIAFIKQAVTPPSGNAVVQFPYRAMNDLNSYSALRFEFRNDECDSWKVFASAIVRSRSWNSGWFSVARRFFLYGSATEFNPSWDDVDRVVDYVSAIEAAVAPEMDFSRRRISRRSALLISASSTEQPNIIALMKQLYDIRSSLVHGTKLSSKSRDWLIENCGAVETIVRQVLVAAVQTIPDDDELRRKMLAGLYDPTDDDRGEFVLQRFQEIRNVTVRKALADKISVFIK